MGNLGYGFKVTQIAFNFFCDVSARNVGAAGVLADGLG